MTCYDENIVIKKGPRVRYDEEIAMTLVEQHTQVPVPEILLSNHQPGKGSIGMTLVPGNTLKTVWDELDEGNKKRICCEIWTMIAQWRKILRPPHLAPLYQCLADGSPATPDPLLQDLEDPPRALNTDQALRDRIYQRYLHFHGRRYEGSLPDMLPHSEISVFTHGDVAPRNIMVDKDYHITGIIDWELAG